MSRQRPQTTPSPPAPQGTPTASGVYTGSERVVEDVEGTNERARGFLRAFAVWVLVAVIALVGASIYSNHYGYFGDRGQFHTFNDRLAKSEFLLRQPRESLADAWVLGSSNTMPFQPQTVERLFGKETFNLGSYWGRVEDVWCWLNFLLEDLETRPELVVLGIEPWTFGANEAGPPFYRSYRRRLLNATEVSKHLDGYHPALLSASSLLDSISIQNLKILIQMTLRHRLERKERVPLERSVFLEDGTSKELNELEGKEFLPDEVHAFYARLQAAESDAERAALEPEREALLGRRLIRLADVLAYLPGDRFDPASLELFERALALCQEHGIEVLVVLLPVHPHFYDFLARETQHETHLQTLRELLAELQGEYPVLSTVLDASHVDLFRGDPAAFHDNFHMTPANTDRVLEALAAERSRAR